MENSESKGQEAVKEWTDFHTLRREENEKYTRLLFFCSFLGPLILILVQTAGVRSTSFYPSWMLLIIVALSFLFYAATRRVFPVDPTIELYLWGCLFAFAAIMGDTVFTPDTPCAISLFYLIYLPLAITDRPVRIWIADGFLSALTLGLDFHVKHGAVLQQDVLQIVFILLVSMVMSAKRYRRTMKVISLNRNAVDSAEHDKLTGVYNRRGGELLIRESIQNRISGSLIIADIDNFKHVNDAYGHSEGDRALREVAFILAANFRATDVVMRMGGDEFVVYSPGMVYYESVKNKLEKVHQSVHSITLGDETQDYVTVSMGCVVNDGSYPTYEALFRVADHILYECKAEGKDSYKILNISYHRN